MRETRKDDSKVERPRMLRQAVQQIDITAMELLAKLATTLERSRSEEVYDRIRIEKRKERKTGGRRESSELALGNNKSRAFSPSIENLHFTQPNNIQFFGILETHPSSESLFPETLPKQPSPPSSRKSELPGPFSKRRF